MLAFLSDDWKPVAVHVRQSTKRVIADVVFDDQHADLDAVEAQVARILSLDIDGKPFDAIDDEVIADLRADNPGLRPVLFSSPYEAAVWAVLSQRTQMRQAAVIRERLDEQHGTAIKVDGVDYRRSITPERLLDLRSVQGMPASKVPWLHDLARAALDGMLDAGRLRAIDPAEAIEELKRIEGIGEFSADLILIRGAGAPDMFPGNEPRLHSAMTA